jgi:hypothetical protein
VWVRRLTALAGAVAAAARSEADLLREARAEWRAIREARRTRETLGCRSNASIDRLGRDGG